MQTIRLQWHKELVRFAAEMRRRNIIFAAAAVLLGHFLTPSVTAQFTPDPTGFNRITCKGGADTIVSIPFFREPAFTGKVAAKNTLGGGDVSITAEGTSPFTANQFTSSSFYIRFREGSALEGASFDINDNDPSSVTVSPGEENLDAISVGDVFDIIPHWTLAAIWPVGSQSSLHLSTSKLLPGRGSLVLFTDASGDGIDLAPDLAFFLTAEGWFQTTAGFPASDDVIVPPGQSLVIRHPSSSGDTVFITENRVEQYDQRIWLQTRVGEKSDNHLGIVRPVPVTLEDLDLDSAFIDSASNDPGDREDELLVFDNADVSQNKSPAKTYFRVGGEWREDDGSTYPVAGSDSIDPSSGIVIRKAATLDGNPVLWVNAPRY